MNFEAATQSILEEKENMNKFTTRRREGNSLFSECHLCAKNYVKPFEK